MNKPLIRIHNIETDEVIDREMNDAEFEVYEKDLELLAKKVQEKADFEVARAALLVKLDISESEAKLLLS